MSLAQKLLSYAQNSSMLCLDNDGNTVDSTIPLQYEFVDTISGLIEVVNELSVVDLIAFDCEMHQHRSYYGITCLLQLASAKGKAYIIDTLALWHEIPKYLGPLFKNPDLIKIGHSLDGGDVPFLYRDFGIHIVAVFDTKIAAESLGIKKLGLASLLEKYHCPHIDEIRLGKQSITNSDWRARPLASLHLRYAALDVLYLIPLCCELVKEMNSVEVFPTQDNVTDKRIKVNDDDGMGMEEGPVAEEDLNRVLSLEEIDDGGMEDDEEEWAGWGVSETCSLQPPSTVGGCDSDTPPQTFPSTNGTKEFCSYAAVSQILLKSQKVCDSKWRPKPCKENDYRQILKLRRKSQKWSEKQLFVLKRLFQWRDAMARLHDESPGYICPPYMLLNAAFYSPRDFQQLMKVWSPIPVFIRESEEGNFDSNVHSIRFLAALKDALIEFESSVAAAVGAAECDVTAGHGNQRKGS